MITQLFIRRLNSSNPGERMLVIAPLVHAFLSENTDQISRDEIGAGLVCVLDDPNPDVRHALARSLAREETAPRHLVRSLAFDQPKVAAPVLLRSPVLSDYDLVELIGEGDARCQLLIARREHVSAAVAAALIEVADMRICLALINNPGAAIVSSSFVRIAERFGSVSEIRAAMLARSDLPVQVRQGLTQALCDALGACGLFNGLVRPERGKRVIRDAWERATMDLAASCSEADLRALIAHLQDTGRLTVALILRALLQGDWTFMVASLAYLSGLPERRVSKLAADRRGAGFQALYTKADLPASVYEGFRTAVAAVRDARAQGNDLAYPANRVAVLERILAAYQEMGLDALDELNGLFTRLLDDAAREQAKSVFWEDAAAA